MVTVRLGSGLFLLLSTGSVTTVKWVVLLGTLPTGTCVALFYFSSPLSHHFHACTPAPAFSFLTSNMPILLFLMCGKGYSLFNETCLTGPSSVHTQFFFPHFTETCSGSCTTIYAIHCELILVDSLYFLLILGDREWQWRMQSPYMMCSFSGMCVCDSGYVTCVCVTLYLLFIHSPPSHSLA